MYKSFKVKNTMKKFVLLFTLILSSYPVQAVSVEEYVKSKIDFLNLFI